MADSALARRRTELLARVKRRREDVERYLDDFFYTRCREVIRIVRRIDSGNKLAGNTTPTKDHSHSPTGWLAVQRRLDTYDYAETAEFVEDMRAVVNRCYEAHGRDSPLAKVARDVELAMEDQFVSARLVEPADFQRILSLARSAQKRTKLEMVQLISFYTDKRQPLATETQKVSFSASELRNATKYRVLQLLLQNAARSTPARDKAPAGGTARKTAVAPGSLPKRPQPPPRPTPSKTLLAGPDSLPFHEEPTQGGNDALLMKPSAASTAMLLERVPQNDGKELVTAAMISPVGVWDDGGDDESQSSTSNGTASEEQPQPQA